MLRTEIDSLKVSQFDLGFRALLHGSEDQEEIPDIYADLHAIGVGLAIIGGLDEFHIRLVGCIHVRSVARERSIGKVLSSRFPVLSSQLSVVSYF